MANAHSVSAPDFFAVDRGFFASLRMTRGLPRRLRLLAMTNQNGSLGKAMEGARNDKYRAPRVGDCRVLI